MSTQATLHTVAARGVQCSSLALVIRANREGVSLCARQRLFIQVASVKLVPDLRYRLQQGAESMESDNYGNNDSTSLDPNSPSEPTAVQNEDEV